jgi:hypothetical protein
VSLKFERLDIERERYGRDLKLGKEVCAPKQELTEKKIGKDEKDEKDRKMAARLAAFACT